MMLRNPTLILLLLAQYANSHKEELRSTQGVFFRKYTEDQAKHVSAVGWVKNTPHGTVIGQVQGTKEIVEIMKNWLKNVGSPMCRIDKAVFSNEKQISTLEYSSFRTKY